MCPLPRTVAWLKPPSHCTTWPATTCDEFASVPNVQGRQASLSGKPIEKVQFWLLTEEIDGSVSPLYTRTEMPRPSSFC